MPEFTFEGSAIWKCETECDLTVKGKHLATVSPPPEFGGKIGYLMPEEIFAAALASCMNTLFILIARNSNFQFRNLETKAIVRMSAEDMENLIFTNICFSMKVKLEMDDERERKKALQIYQIAQRTCPIRQSWGEKVPISFEFAFL